MVERFRIAHMRFWPLFHTAGAKLPPFPATDIVLDHWSEPRDGTFRLALHRPDGTVVTRTSHKGWSHDLLGQKADTYLIRDTKEDDVPEGTLVEILRD